MSSPLLLEGEYEPQPSQVSELAELRAQVFSLAKALSEKVDQLRDEISGIRNGLAIAASGEQAVNLRPPRSSAVWDEWKSRLGPTCARFIEAMLQHGELDAGQLAIITKCGRKNVSTYIHRLNKASLIRKNGNKFSLKEL